MATAKWKERLRAFKEDERPEAVLVVAGQTDLLRIAIAWMQTEVRQTRRTTKLREDSEADVWSWLWENSRYDRAELLTRIPNATSRTGRNLGALIANRVLYPDGTISSFVARYLKERVVALFSRSLRRPIRDAAAEG